MPVPSYLWHSVPPRDADERDPDEYRLARVTGYGYPAGVAAYLPRGWTITRWDDDPAYDGVPHREKRRDGADPRRFVAEIMGRDREGWTLEEYVAPRLQSGLYGVEILR